MRKKLKKFVTILFALTVLLSLTSVLAVTELETEQGSSYQYGYWRNVLSAPVAYTCTDSFSLRTLSQASGSPEDISIGEDGTCYIVDKTQNCLYIIGPDFSDFKIIKEYTFEGKSYPFNQPEGVFALKGRIYIANSGGITDETKDEKGDTTGGNIVILDKQGNTVKVIQSPSLKEMTTTIRFEPVKVAADLQGRLFVISRNQTQGIVRLTEEGEFVGYLGAVRVNPTPWQLFLRAIASDEMKKGMLKFIPTEYSNLTTDSDGFVYCVVETVDSGDIYSAIYGNAVVSRLPVRKLNSLGNDILDIGGLPPVGDIEFAMYGSEGGSSKFIDVSVSKNGVYSVLDGKRNRIFTYDTDGNLLYVFGGKGSGRDQLSQPAAISYYGDEIFVLDKENETVKRFSPTPYAQSILMAIQFHKDGEYEKENEIWQQIKKEYIGSDLAYLGIGKNAYVNGNYKEAMVYFKTINDKEYYSKAFSAATRKTIEKNLYWLIPVAIASVILLAVGIRYLLRALLKSKNPTLQGVLYGGHVILHPFDGFWDIRHEKKGSFLSATIILIAAYLVDVLFIRFQPYIFQTLNLDETNVFVKGLSDIILPVFMWVISNWCFTTLFDGKGTASDIYIATCYSLFPIVVFMPIILVVSQAFALDAMPIYNALIALVYVWVGFMIFSSTLTIHQFSFLKTVGMVILTLIGIAVIIFISLLCLNLFVEIASFIGSIYKELAYF
ncbi:MAG TPA: YIP1 family protein [Candidatus Avimonas sp.]|nr:YIP1 family protein [Candidatus Avimonas sp.]HQD38344.1 YIP1 family protein [Candidatus Avimonas sp.]